MLQVEITGPDGRQRMVEAPEECTIGKSVQNEIRLDSWRVAKEHARLFSTPSGVLLDDLGGFGGVSVNGKRVEVQYGPLKETDLISIGPFTLRILKSAQSAPPVQAASPQSRSDTAPRRNQAAAEEIQASRRLAEKAQKAVLEQRARPTHTVAGDTPGPDERKETALVVAPDPTLKELEFEWRKRIHGKLLETMDLRRQDVSSMSDDRLRAETEALIRQIIEDQHKHIPEEIDRALLRVQVLNEAIGLGPLEELLDDDSVTEVMVNRYDEIYVERRGKLLRHPLTFTGDRAVLGVIERIVAPLGRRIDESSPMVDARLKDGSRVNAIIPPLALKGPALTIRKFAKRKLQASDLVAFDAISQEMADFLKVCVEARKNIVVSGGTGSGKTTLLNILSNFIPSGERVITVEDAAELKLHHEHLISLEARPPNIEGKGAVLIRDLVKNTLRMRPDRIVVGECRGAEALDMLQAMNTGHEGSLTTLHANTTRDALARLETMVLMAGMDLPLTAIREQVASAVDLIVQQTRFACGSRKVTSIAEITGMESGKIQIQELFRFVHQGYGGPEGKVQGYFTGCGLVPGFYEELLARGAALDIGIFKTVLADDVASLAGEAYE
ncbi:ATPase, T2SS/T4P/T4SS family [Noviherbaspirillum aridicola]|uniref:Secretory protein n=1 Tax=Noviherbaspirillum aridicola TaxID=2849687 RepID=A0ABQ4Q6B5_9BURK|nr:ATPase, T2SS/T4P/T4SS family [Noviherbaspirillum aridicola]GIZ52345.1 secretory protein [Noviherbaspirillum aridicola]